MARGYDTRNEIDCHEGNGTTDKPRNRGKYPDNGRQHAKNQFEKSVFHKRKKV